MANRDLELAPQQASSSSQAPPGVSGRTSQGLRMPSPPKEVLARLAAALAHLPKSPGGRGHGKDLFLP